MLKNLFIQNYAIIDEIRIDFSAQMNVITGETGAGKSILMGALSLILGDRADTSVLLNRDKKCIVEGTFENEKNSPVFQIIHQLDLHADEGDVNEIMIRREIAVNGKSRAFINDTPVNLDQLRQVSSLLVDLHRQFDTLTLGESAFQRNVLDALAGNNDRLREYENLFTIWKTGSDELDRLKSQKSSFLKEYDYHRFLFDELDDAGFRENELEEIDQELKMLGNAEGIKNSLSFAADALVNGEQHVLQQLKSVQHQLESVSRYHPAAEDITKRLRSIYIELQDVADEIDKLNEHVRYDPSKIEQLNDRLSQGYKLLKKHGVQTTNQLLAIRSELQGKLDAVLNIDEQITALEKEVAQMFVDVEKKADGLSATRTAQVRPFEENVNRLLKQVGMPNARLKVGLQVTSPGISGKDDIEFLFDANKSNRFEPIRKVASGGELSRLMLSIKSLVAESMDMPTLIFDEIDTGISGEAARQVGMIMHGLSRKRQLITITHQPQIAGRAHAHLFVYKDIRNDVVRTGIRELSGEERITAIARMLSGEKPTAAALENAREMVMN